MSINFDYKKIREIRALCIEEIASDITNLTTEHIKLAEMRVQTIIMAGLDETDIVKEKSKWQKK